MMFTKSYTYKQRIKISQKLTNQELYYNDIIYISYLNDDKIKKWKYKNRI